jgi:hypothetical protein
MWTSILDIMIHVQAPRLWPVGASSEVKFNFEGWSPSEKQAANNIVYNGHNIVLL